MCGGPEQENGYSGFEGIEISLHINHGIDCGLKKNTADTLRKPKIPGRWSWPPDKEINDRHAVWKLREEEEESGSPA